ncbi:N5-carboxyaminoimidazole ribonucleotide mutase [Pseudodonghicola xiamenensis]|uniref:N5-carboxyaminoimidazole ribonucleotide mutase n=2 Tax=Pseudodonghicola xiamenensis TaxID=337702 RepID=A0A8J3H846_9RHOB|nr:N5-carboxyaminoimidazole ribonucleotide mutase [Pseudodonghicola xiamenensis]
MAGKTHCLQDRFGYSARSSAAYGTAWGAQLMNNPANPPVGIIMGSQSDWPTMKLAAEILDTLEIPYEARIVSAHRTPDRLWDYGKSAVARGLQVIIAGAGGAAHLPGMMASKTRVPVIGVPIQTRTLSGVDSLYSIVQMPKGFPVATMAIGAAGGANAGLMAAAILALQDPALAKRLDDWRTALSASIPEEPVDD